VHDIYRRWRAVADGYGDRPFVGEVFVSSAERLARYVRPDELHTAFDFRFLQAGWGRCPLARRRSTTTCTRWARWAHPRRGSCPTTIRPAM
jgi:alpha-glucosidase